MSLNERVDGIISKTTKPLIWLSLSLVLGGYGWGICYASKEAVKRAAIIFTPLSAFYGVAALISETYCSRNAQRLLKDQSKGAKLHYG